MKMLLALVAVVASGQTLRGPELVQALQKGGLIIVMRHANSPREIPPNQKERVLDEEGRRTATAFGKALRDLKIPIGEVDSSPTYRALETARNAQLPTPKTREELGDNGRSMQGGTAAQAEWLRKSITQFPKGTNRILITHSPNLTSAFPEWATNLGEGEALIIAPGPTLVARIKIEEWPALKP